MNKQDKFSEVRSLLHGGPSRAQLERLDDLVMEAEAIDHDEIATTWAPYIDTHLQMWYAQRPWSVGWELDWTGWEVEEPLRVSSERAQRLLQARSALLGSLRGLSLQLGGEEAGSHWGELLGAGAWPRLEWLGVTGRGEGDDVWVSALAGRALPALRALGWDLSPRGLSAAGRRLLEAPWLGQLEALAILGRLERVEIKLLLARLTPRLRHLTLGVRADTELLELIAGAPSCQGLTTLDLRTDNSAPRGEMYTRPMHATAQLPALRALSVQSFDLTAKNTRDLLDWPTLGHLTALKLEGGDLGEAGLRAVARHDHTRGLRRLGLGLSGLTGEALEEARVVEGLRWLEELSLWGNNLSARGVAALARGSWPALRVLHLGLVELDDAAFGPLCDGLARMPALEVLNLYKNPIGDASVERLMAHLPPSLRELHLGDTQITDVGARIMADTPAMRRLEYLDIIDAKITADGSSILRLSPHTSHLMN